MNEKYCKIIIGKSVGQMKTVIQKNLIEVLDDFNFSTSLLSK